MRRHSLVLWDFHFKQGRMCSPTCSPDLTKEKELTNQTSSHARRGHHYAIPILFCFSDVFSHIKKDFIITILSCFSGVFSHFKNVFICHVWEGNNCIDRVKPRFETAMSLKSLQRFWRKIVEKLAHPQRTLYVLFLVKKKFAYRSYFFDVTQQI